MHQCEDKDCKIRHKIQYACLQLPSWWLHCEIYRLIDIGINLINHYTSGQNEVCQVTLLSIVLQYLRHCRCGSIMTFENTNSF